MSPLHSQRESSWGRRIVLVLGSVAALAVAGYVGSVVGPHFKASSVSPTTSTTAPPGSTTTSTVPHASVKVLVANGTQEPNAAGHFAQLLGQQGWNVSPPGNSTAAASATTIYYAPTQQQAAGLIAAELNVPATGLQPMGSTVPVTNATGADVVVVIGPDLAGTGFPATTTPTT